MLSVLAEIDTRDYPVADRFAHWREFVAAVAEPLEIRDLSGAGGGAGFTAAMRVVDLGSVTVIRHRHPALSVRRPPRVGRPDTTGHHHLVLNVRGEATVTQYRRTATLAGQQFTLIDCGAPFDAIHRGDDGDCEAVILPLPGSLPGLPEPRLARLCARVLPAAQGVGALLAEYLLELVGHPDRYRPGDAAHLAAVTTELASALLLGQLDTGPAGPRSPSDAALLATVRSYVDANLGDPRLSPATIAVHHHISTRTLHRLFQATGTTVAAFIRSRRLQRCRQELLRDQRPVRAIAARWGFTDQAHFSRVFRAEYGVTPGRYRELRREPDAELEIDTG
jgi:AraC-like DNA-binding protein